jgi:hypothetical protein
MIENREARADSAGFGIVRPVNEPRYAGLNHSAATHGARFDGDVKSCAEQAVILNYFCSGTQSNDFGVRGRVAIGNRPITGARNYAIVERENCSDGNLASLGGVASFVEGGAHEFSVECWIFRHATPE